MNISLKCKLICLFLVINSILYAESPQLVYSTFLGGSSEDRAHGMALDSHGNIYLTAPIQSTDFPVTANALQTSATGIYIAKINAVGDSLLFSTYLGAVGGANYAHGIAVDQDGCIYVAGNTTNAAFPTTAGAFDRSYNGPAGDVSHGDAFVVKLNPQGNQIIYSTFIGGKGMDICGKIALDKHGDAYIIGTTSSSDFPVTNDAFDTSYNGGDSVGRGDIFVAKLNADGSKLVYCTYIGGSATDTYGNDIIVDDSGCVYFAGTTASVDFPATANAYDAAWNGGTGNMGAGDGVIVKLNAAGTAIDYATFIGGSGDDYANCLALDNQGNVYVGGSASSDDFPTTRDAYNRINNKGGFIAKFNPQFNQLLYATLWDANIKTIAVHETGAILVSGVTEADTYPVTTNAYSSTRHGSGDIFISILVPGADVLSYSTFFGGKKNEAISSLLLNEQSLYLCGNTNSADFPVSANAYDKTFNGGTNPWGGDAFVSKFIISSGAMSIHKYGNLHPDKFQLFQNYPNPFNPATTISYQLAVDCKVKMHIYDTLGQEIKTLFDSCQSVGEHSVIWNGTDHTNNPVSSGVYLYSLVTNEINLQKKMILIR